MNSNVYCSMDLLEESRTKIPRKRAHLHKEVKKLVLKFVLKKEFVLK